MYSTIQEAWGDNLFEKYSNKIDNNPIENVSENLSEFFNPKLIQNKKRKKKKSIMSVVSSIASNTVSNISNKKMTCKEIFYHIKKCKKCQKKIGKYLNRNKIVININLVEIRKMLLLLIFIAMIIIIINMLFENKR